MHASVNLSAALVAAAFAANLHAQVRSSTAPEAEDSKGKIATKARGDVSIKYSPGAAKAGLAGAKDAAGQAASKAGGAAGAAAAAAQAAGKAGGAAGAAAAAGQAAGKAGGATGAAQAGGGAAGAAGAQADDANTAQRQTPKTDFGSVLGQGVSKAADAAAEKKQGTPPEGGAGGAGLAAPFIPGGAIVGAAVSGRAPIEGGGPAGGAATPTPLGTPLAPILRTTPAAPSPLPIPYPVVVDAPVKTLQPVTLPAVQRPMTALPAVQQPQPVATPLPVQRLPQSMDMPARTR